MNQNNSGFTLIEIVVVMVLISIIAGTVFTRSITTNQINFRGQAEKIINHIRFAQAKAMKRDEIWGVYSSGSAYWLFKWEPSGDGINNKIAFPGEEKDTVSLTAIDMKTDSFTVFYYKATGKPYKSMSPFTAVGYQTVPDLTLEFSISAIDDSDSLDLTITPETGLIVIK
jgi:prepilin-type N-terminal cleavage/methylation domain-containing protein